MSRSALAQVNQAPQARSSSSLTRSAISGLRIGPVNDTFEREADRAADAVVNESTSMLDWTLARMSIEARIQRRCGCAKTADSSAQCADCHDKTLQHKQAGTANASEAPWIVHDILNSPGKQIDQPARSFFERRFGQDFSSVSVRTGTRAADAANAVNARAYTVGENVVMNAGEDLPQSTGGRWLLAHELAHVVQQRQPSGEPAAVLVPGKRPKRILLPIPS